MYSQITSILYFSCAEMGMTGAPSATVPKVKENASQICNRDFVSTVGATFAALLLKGVCTRKNSPAAKPKPCLTIHELLGLRHILDINKRNQTKLEEPNMSQNSTLDKLLDLIKLLPGLTFLHQIYLVL